MEIKNRQVDLFRCHLDPGIGPKSQQAYMRKSFPGSVMELTPIGVYVRLVTHLPNGKPETSEHIVPYSNVQSIKLTPIPAKASDEPAV